MLLKVHKGVLKQTDRLVLFLHVDSKTNAKRQSKLQIDNSHCFVLFYFL